MVEVNHFEDRFKAECWDLLGVYPEVVAEFPTVAPSYKCQEGVSSFYGRHSDEWGMEEFCRGQKFFRGLEAMVPTVNDLAMGREIALSQVCFPRVYATKSNRQQLAARVIEYTHGCETRFRSRGEQFLVLVLRGAYLTLLSHMEEVGGFHFEGYSPISYWDFFAESPILW